MTIDEIVAVVESLGGVLTLAPGPGDGTPELAWGDVFFYFAPDGQVPPGQPFATIVTKDYPHEPSSGLGNGVYRVNIDARRRGQPDCENPAEQDVLMAHPVYGRQGWVCVVNPGPSTARELFTLLRAAHNNAEQRWNTRNA